MKIILILLLILVVSKSSYGQEETNKNDTLNIYREIESYSQKSKYTKYIYRIFFNPVAVDQAREKTSQRRIKNNFDVHEGKIIRKIIVETLDPFSNSIADTDIPEGNFLARLGNRLHLKTNPHTVRNLLLIRENQPFDPWLVRESERLVRSRSYITDVRFGVRSVSGNSDSVDIYIRQLDKWSIIPGGSFNSKRAVFRLTDNNFLGFGHEFFNNITWNHTTGKYAYRTKYNVPNIRNTFISSTVRYGTDEYGNFEKRFAVDRPFFSAYARWAGGINISQHLRTDSLWPTLYNKYKYNQQDIWLGHAVRIFRGDTDFRRTTNFIAATRIVRTRFLEKPDSVSDPAHYYADENLYLTTIGISSRQYVQDLFIFRFGVTEDVPIGQMVSLTAGYQQRNNAERLYVATRFSAGNYYSWGYMSSTLEYGTFFTASRAEQGMFRVGLNYYTELKGIGKWKYRQFVKPQATLGFRREPYDSLTLNNEDGIHGFNSPVLSGTSRLLLTSQTQFYAPWNVLGFRFGPFLTLTLGMLGNESSSFKNSRIYSKFGVGVLVKNDNLVMNTFQFSFAFYPDIPGRGDNLLKMNTFQTTDFGFRDFEIDKPRVTKFR